MALHSSWCPTGDQAWAMIDDLNAGEAEMWKYVDDTTISEVIAKGQESQDIPMFRLTQNTR